MREGLNRRGHHCDAESPTRESHGHKLGSAGAPKPRFLHELKLRSFEFSVREAKHAAGPARQLFCPRLGVLDLREGRVISQ